MAEAVGAAITSGTDIAVAASCCIGLVNATVPCHAAIVSTEVSVVAISLDSILAGPFHTTLADGAGIAVRTGTILVRWYRAAFAANRVATGCQAGGVRPRRCWAGDCCVWVNGAFIRDRIGVAEQRAVADIAIFKWHTVAIFDAVTLDIETSARTLAASVIDGAWIAVIALAHIEGVEAAAGWVAGIGGADVAIVAVDVGADADSLFAVVRQGADVAVGTLGAGEGGVLATRLWVAGIFSTGILVVATDVVYFAIAVVIEAVAFLKKWFRRVAGGEAGIGASANPRALTSFGSLGARGREG